jgi:6-phosphogluconolactonase (cycloisomerase 2 family)
VNAGSDEISAFRVDGNALTALGNVGSGGDLPISLAVSGDLLYVLNDGTSPNVTGFRIAPSGTLTPIAGSTRPLSAAAPDAAQVGFSTDGTRLVVTEKATNQIVTWPVLGDGTLGSATIQASAGQTPFGFAFDKRGTLISSEAFGGAPNASVLSSYRASGGGWAAVSPLSATTETAACWVVVTPNGRFAYTTNTGSASVSGFAVGQDGSLTLLDADGVTGSTGGAPIDAAVSVNGRYLYTLNSGGLSISAFRVGSDGSLTPVGTTTGIPAGATGLVAR